MFSWLTKLRLQTRISLLVTLGLALIFAFMAWEGRQIAQANAEMTLQERLTVARVVAQHLDQDLERILSRLAHVAAFPTINLDDGDLEPEKAELRALYRSNGFGYVLLLDKDGLVLWTEPYLPDVINRERMECPHVQETLRVGAPAIACVPHALTPQSPVIAPVVPLRNAQGAIVGALGAAIDPSSPPFVQIFQGMAPGRTGYIQLIDDNGTVLAHTERQHLFQQSEHADLFLSLLKEKKSAITTYTMTEEGKGTFREVVAFAPLSQAPWGVAVEQEEAEFLAPSMEASRRMEVVAVVVVVAALLMTWLTTRSVLEPVRKLSAASERIAAGDLATPVPPLGQDEIGELGRRFEAMRARLARWGEELEAAVQKRTRELSTLYTIDRAAAESLDLDVILAESLDKVLEVLEVEAGAILLLEPDGQTLATRAHRGYSEEFARTMRHIRLGEAVASRAMAEQQPVVVDVSEYPTERLAPFFVKEGIQTIASIPLVSKGQALGALSLNTRRPRAFPPEELELLTSIGRQLGGVAQNARLYEETRARAERLSVLNRIARALSATLKLDELLEIVHREIAAVIEAEAFFVALYDAATNELDYRIQVDQGVREPSARKPLPSNLTGSVVTTKQPRLVRDCAKEVGPPPPETLWGSMQAAQSWLGVPMLVGDNLVGVISVQAYHPNAYGAAEQELLSTIADAVAVAIENARLYEAEQRRAARLDALQRLSIELAAVREESAVLNTLVVRAATIAESPTCTVMLVDAATNAAVLSAQTGLPAGTPRGLRVPLALPILRHSLETGEPIILSDINHDAPAMRTILVRQDIRAFFAYPMIREGRVLGFITLSSLAPRTPSKEEITAYRLLAERAATALENARLYEADARHVARLKIIGEVGQHIATTLNLDELLRQVVATLVERFGYYYANILLVDAAAGEIVLRASAGKTATALEGYRLKIGQQGLTGWVAEAGKPLLVNDVTQEPRYNFVEELRDARSELAVPIMSKGQVIGVMDVQSAMLNAFDEEDLFTLQALADQTAVGIENARLYASLAEAKRALEAKVRDLERFTKFAVGRELQMKALKERIRELEEK